MSDKASPVNELSDSNSAFLNHRLFNLSNASKTFQTIQEKYKLHKKQSHEVQINLDLLLQKYRTEKIKLLTESQAVKEEIWDEVKKAAEEFQFLKRHQIKNQLKSYFKESKIRFVSSLIKFERDGTWMPNKKNWVQKCSKNSLKSFEKLNANSILYRDPKHYSKKHYYNSINISSNTSRWDDGLELLTSKDKAEEPRKNDDNNNMNNMNKIQYKTIKKSNATITPFQKTSRYISLNTTGNINRKKNNLIYDNIENYANGIEKDSKMLKRINKKKSIMFQVQFNDWKQKQEFLFPEIKVKKATEI